MKAVIGDGRPVCGDLWGPRGKDDDSVFAAMEKKHEQNRLKHLQRMAQKLGYTLTATENPACS